MYILDNSLSQWVFHVRGSIHVLFFGRSFWECHNRTFPGRTLTFVYGVFGHCFLADEFSHRKVNVHRDVIKYYRINLWNHLSTFFQERFYYDTLRNSFQRTAREWNHLPDTTVGASSIEEFRVNPPGMRYKSRSMSKSRCWILYIITSLLIPLRCSKSATQVMLTCLSRILVFCGCNHLWRSGQLLKSQTYFI
jgi:hypothetical protein